MGSYLTAGSLNGNGMRTKAVVVLSALTLVASGCDRSDGPAGAKPDAPVPSAHSQAKPGNSPTTTSAAAQAQQTHFVYAKIVHAIDPLERGSRYEDPLQTYLTANGLGEVTGGGTMQGKDGKILFVGIDIEVHDIEKAVPLIAEKLARLGAPPGSQLEYELNGVPTTRPIGAAAR
jgi:hypothetical protein